jgi:hypothetical protein
MRSLRYMPSEEHNQDTQQEPESIADGNMDETSSILSLNTFFRSQPGASLKLAPPSTIARCHPGRPRQVRLLQGPPCRMIATRSPT